MTALELIDILFPLHSRTGCSDENLENGIGVFDPTLTPRCRRCFVLELVKGEITISDNDDVDDIPRMLGL